jgi:2-hydroxychromene-2-carboxylate isomerase
MHAHARYALQAMPEQTIEFYADPISPYVYIAWHRLRALASGRPELRVVVRPVLLAGLLGHFGQLGPAEIAPKRVFTFKDVVRRCHELGLALAGPATHPFNPLQALRAVLAAPEADRGAALGAIVDAGWGRGIDMADAGALTEALDGVGLDGRALIAATADPEIKRRLTGATAAAAQRGVFGVPTFAVGDELVFGQDRLPDVLRLLAGEDPVDSWHLAAMLARPAGANRPRPESPRGG